MEKQRDMTGEEKGNGHQHGQKPRILKPVSIAWKLTQWGREATLDTTYGGLAHGAMDGWIYK